MLAMVESRVHELGQHTPTQALEVARLLCPLRCRAACRWLREQPRALTGEERGYLRPPLMRLPHARQRLRQRLPRGWEF
ncbi:hypothetical protein [Mumia zhuanghuii]|uniref:hypothetical protein n=1 Tax=Mumia zhuanghuii TaxID=2585211 RepID=UPI001E3A53A1|nr:hypothetical protein [Mumia zhuanghuii]